jgi:hypothetical protein
MASREASRVVRVGAWAALAAGAALVVKVAHIFATDGSAKTLPAILYIAGFVLGMVGAAGIGSYYGGTRLTKIALGIGTFLGFVFFMMMLSDGVGAAIDAVVDAPAYVADEAPIALAGLAWLFAGYKLLKNSDNVSRPA